MLAIIILAAGRGTRMKSELPKVMHKVAGKPMLAHVLDAVRSLNPAQTLVVSSLDLLDHVADLEAEFVVQDNPLGTGHAVQCAFKYLNTSIKDVLIVCGDTPLIQQKTLSTLLESKADLSLLGMKLSDFTLPYGRLVLDQDQVADIIETKDATLEQKQIPFANAGIYKISIDVLKFALPYLENNNNAGEFYLTDIVKIAHEANFKVNYTLGDHAEFFGVNSKIDLSHAEKIMQDRLRLKHMEQGVTLIDPSTVFFHADTKVGSDTIIHPFVTFGKNVQIENNVTIYQNCHIEKSVLKAESEVGPFARLRGGVILDEKAQIGNFVEVKNSHLKTGAKIKHLSYIGDSSIGMKSNIGAGVITCNYNGFEKFTTTIGDQVFVGSNTSLVAPLTIGDGAIVGAGSIITNDVDSNAIALTRSEQIVKEDGAKRYRQKAMTAKMNKIVILENKTVSLSQ